IRAASMNAAVTTRDNVISIPDSWRFRVTVVVGATGSFAERRLRCGQAGNWHAEWAARDVVQPDLVAELNRIRVAALLAADAELDLRPCLAAAFDGELHQPADALGID